MLGGQMTKLRITGMSCGHCSGAVAKALGAVPGVRRVVEVSHERAEALVEGEASPEALIAAVVGEGYQAEVVE
jgi:copper chaperone